MAVGVVLALATLLIYAPVYRYGYIGYDDPLYVDSPLVQAGLTARGVAWAFELGPGHAANYHPLTLLSHMLDFTLFGRRPGAHHFVNVALHAAAAVTLLLVLASWTGRIWPSAAVAAAFAWHPMHVQSVAWIAERKDVLSALLFMLTLLAYGWYAARPRAARYAVVFAAATLGLLAKPMLVTLPLVLLLVDAWPLRRIDRGNAGRGVAEKLPIVAVAVLIGVLTMLAQDDAGAIAGIEKLPIGMRLGNATVGYARYLFKTIWPVDLAIFYPYRVWPVGAVIAAVALLAAATVAAAMQWRQRPYLLVGWLWFVGMLLPVIGIVQVGQQSIADRYSYLPHIGLFLAVVWLAADAFPRRTNGMIAGAVLLACAVGTIYQLRFWSDDLALFGRALAVTRDNYLAHGYVGKALAARGDDAAALRQYEEALRLNERYPEVHYNLGNLLLRAGQIDEAMARYRRAVEIRPGLADAHNNLAAVLAGRQRYAEAARHYEAALAADPNHKLARQGLAGVRQRMRSATAPATQPEE